MIVNYKLVYKKTIVVATFHAASKSVAKRIARFMLNEYKNSAKAMRSKHRVYKKDFNLIQIAKGKHDV
jgi:carbon starvation protein CstA